MLVSAARGGGTLSLACTRPAAVARVRWLAILPQPPAFSKTDLLKEKALRRKAEASAIAMRRETREALATPQFGKLDRPASVLRAYEEKRELLSPRDAAAALLALGKLNRAAASHEGHDTLHDHPLAAELRADVAVSAPYLPSRDLSNALLGAAYLRSADDDLLSALCAAATEKAAAQFSQHDVASTLFSLGQLGRRESETLLPKLLSRVLRQARTFHALEMTLCATGLAQLGVAPPNVLDALSRAAIPKLDEFGAEELPSLLSALSSLGWHDEQLLRLAASRLPALLTHMAPKKLSEMAAVFAESQLWIPSALQVLADEAALKAPSFGATHAVVMLAALGRMRWDHPGAAHALVGRVAELAAREVSEAEEAAAGHTGLSGKARRYKARRSAACTFADVALCMRAVSRAPSASSSPSLPALLHTAAPLLEAARKPRRGRRGGGAVSSTPVEAARRDLASLTNAMLQLGLPPPAGLEAHVRHALDELQKVGGTARGTAGGTAGTSSDSSDDSEAARAARRADRRAEARLANALRAWTGDEPATPGGDLL
jgi:hypothetical protein